ncbi:MAG: nucleotidyl transferase AbiEii/AbiGii toxin family protein, partial [Bryobacteraceae bacterium]
TLPRPTAPNSRVRDLVDLVLLIRSGTLDATRVVECLRQTFARRDTHRVPRTLEAPPENWTTPSPALAEECALEISVFEAFVDLAGYFGGLELPEQRDGLVFKSLRRLPVN